MFFNKRRIKIIESLWGMFSLFKNCELKFPSKGKHGKLNINSLL